MTSDTHSDAIRTVERFFDYWRAGHIELALKCWSPTALWHIAGSSTRSGDYSPQEYLAMAGQWRAEYPSYRAQFGDLQCLGELAFFAIHSRGGEAPGEALGMMLYRVVNGSIVEGWAIPASDAGRYAF